MDSTLTILRTLAKAGKTVTITVTGHSMAPLLQAGDCIDIRREEAYTVGDIVVFVYLDGELLVHRIVGMEGETLLCKGDNAFRLEPILNRQIIGRVLTARRRERTLPTTYSRFWTRLLCSLSLKIGRHFSRQGDVGKTRATTLYKLYARLFLRRIPHKKGAT